MVFEKKYFVDIFFKGFCMGLTELIPGVSSGTIALFLGIYQQLLTNIKKIEYRSLLKLNFKFFFKSIDFRFFAPLILGMLFALFSFSKLVHYFLSHELFRKFLLSFFLGAILTCIYFLFKDIKISLDKIAFIILGALFCFFISFVNSNFFESSLNIYLKLIFCGFVAILAALLPGISGSLILVIFGIYPIIINALSNISNFQNIKIILFLSFGVFLGLSIFPRFILFFLRKYYNQTLSFLIGLMIGSIYTLWPFFTYRKTYLDSKLILVNEQIQFPNIFSLEFIKCFAFILFGSFVFYKIKQLSTKKDKKINEDTCI